MTRDLQRVTSMLEERDNVYAPEKVQTLERTERVDFRIFQPKHERAEDYAK